MDQLTGLTLTVFASPTTTIEGVKQSVHFIHDKPPDAQRRTSSTPTRLQLVTHRSDIRRQAARGRTHDRRLQHSERVDPPLGGKAERRLSPCRGLHSSLYLYERLSILRDTIITRYEAESLSGRERERGRRGRRRRREGEDRERGREGEGEGEKARGRLCRLTRSLFHFQKSAQDEQQARPAIRGTMPTTIPGQAVRYALFLRKASARSRTTDFRTPSEKRGRMLMRTSGKTGNELNTPPPPTRKNT